MDDASLVEAARSGDGSAWAAIYDRYADKLHDHCHRILRDRDEAADALHDAFIAASRNLEQLRDPTRLRPWLYSICRHEAVRRARKRSRVELTDDVGEMTSVDEDLGRGARAEELQELVWSAAAGLNARDQALLDLNLRQGLEGQGLADAMGTSLNNSYVMLSRLRDQVERSLGALLIARLGREDCEELDALLQGWDGRFSPLLRKRVARHVDGCDICSERRAAVVSPLALLAAAPLVPAPQDLRDRVLSALDTGGAVPISFTRAGFAGPSPGTERRPAPAWVLGAVACIVLLVAGLLVAQVGGDDATELTASEGTTTTADGEPATSPAHGVTTTTGADGSSTTSPDVAPPSTGAAGPPSTDGTSVVPPPPTTTVPPTTTASSTTTTTTAPSTTTSTTAPPDTTAPTIGSMSSSERSIQISCGATTSTIISAAVADDVALRRVVLSWTGDPGSGSTTMAASGGTYSAELPPGAPFERTGTLTYTVTATDTSGNTSSAGGTIRVDPCPQ